MTRWDCRSIARLLAVALAACAVPPLRVVAAFGDSPAQALGASVDPASAPNVSSPVRVTATVEPKDVTIGTRFRYTIRVEADPGVEVAMPLLAERLGDYPIVDFGHRDPVTGNGGVRVSELWYDLVAFETGSQYVPSVPLAYKAPTGAAATVETPKVVVNVVSLITQAGGADDIPAIRDAVPIVAPGPSLLWVIGGLGVAAGLGWIGRRWWRRRAAAAAAPARAAHEIALEELDKLRAQKLVENGQHERYYIALTDIVRRYVEARFGLHAPEMTTDEFLAAAQRSRDLISTHRSALQDFLVEADLVKFARHVPTRERAERSWSAAHDFVAATRPSEVTSAAA